MTAKKTASRKEAATPCVGHPLREQQAPDDVQGVSAERHSSMGLVETKRRVADHGEVFTPARMFKAMLGLVKGETERIDSRFLEPACGSGNFLVKILQRKLRRRTEVREVRLREAALCPSCSDVLLRN